MGGSSAWLDKEGNYYSAKTIKPSVIEFKKFSNPDSTGFAQWREIKNIELGEELTLQEFLGIDNNMFLYLMFEDANYNKKIRIYTTDYLFKDEFTLPKVTSKYYLSVQPFLRADGNVYEFRCLDNGLHVIRWFMKE